MLNFEIKFLWAISYNSILVVSALSISALKKNDMQHSLAVYIIGKM